MYVDSVSWNWPQATQFNWSSNPVSFPFRPEFSPQVKIICTSRKFMQFDKDGLY